MRDITHRYQITALDFPNKILILQAVNLCLLKLLILIFVIIEVRRFLNLISVHSVILNIILMFI